MHDIILRNRAFIARSLFFTWYHRLPIIKKIGLAIGWACVTGVMAQFTITLPWTPIPITGQTATVLLSGIVLGKWWGGISQTLYVILGVIGVPWFSGGHGGLTSLVGPAGGYLIGFILSALFVGYIVDAYPKVKNFRRLLLLMFFGNFFLIHIPGLLQLHLWLSLVQHNPPTLWQLLLMGWIPFIIGDIIKIIIAATIATGILPKDIVRR
jgi:biotin transport system substrate-specific component